MKKLIVSLLVLLLVAILSFFVFKNFGPKNDKIQEEAISSESVSIETTTKPESPKSIDPILIPNQNDVVLGNADAKVTIVEYASLSCPHCAAFYSESFPRLKTEYIDKGEVKFIYRDFPLNHPALAAAVISKCYAAKLSGENKSQKYHDFIKALFKTQESWAFNEKFLEKLESIAKLSGFSGAEFKTCVDDEKIKNQILNDRLVASQKLQIDSTPTFFINGEKVGGYSNYTNIKNVIEKHLQ